MDADLRRLHFWLARSLVGIVREFAILFEFSGEGASSLDPRGDDDAEDDSEVGRREREGAEDDDERLLDERAAALTERPPDDINGRLALGLLLLVQRDVGHLLALRRFASIRVDILG